MEISVLMVTYNRGVFIKEAIYSVLNQTFNDLELIIVDDGSTDDTAKIVEEFNDKRIKLIKNENNLGISKSRNKGVLIAEGEYIAVLDSDDLWLDKDKLKKQLEFLEKNTEYGVVGTAIQIINEDGKIIGEINNPTDDEDVRKKMLWKNPFVHSSVLVKKDALSNQPYDENLKVGEDYKLWLEIGKKYKFANFNEKMVCYRVHSKNTVSSKTLEALRNNIFLIKEYKNFYPNYYISIVRRWFRLNIYLLVKKMGVQI